MKSGIYIITNLITNLFYIGSATDFKIRWRKHVNDLNHNCHDNSYLQNAWNKYSSDVFEFKILECVKDKNKLLEIEQRWINWTKCYERNIGYNLAPKADSVKGIKWSEASKKKLSKSKEGNKYLIGNKFRRRMDKWPHELGNKCRCDECRKKSNLENNLSKIERRKKEKINNYIHAVLSFGC